MSVNKVMLIGRLGKDPEMRYLDNNVALARFPIATSESYKGQSGERVEKTEWHNIVVWGKKVDVVEQYLKKGSEIALEGKLVNRSYEKDGATKYITEINMNEMQMLGKKEG